jgi:hypothetical protein
VPYLYRVLRLLLFLCVFSSASCLAAPCHFSYDAACSQAYQHLLAMRFAEAHTALAVATRTDPQNLIPTYLADYEDCIVLLMNCDQQEYDARSAHLDQRLTTIDKGDKQSPWYRFCKAGIYLHWAIISVRFGEQFKAACNFHKSFNLLKENAELFPQWEYNTVFSGLQRAVVGSLPPTYRWLASVMGMRGNIREGYAKLASFVDMHHAGDPIYDEAILYYIYVRYYLLMEQDAAWAYLSNTHFSTTGNLLNAYVKTHIALDHHKTDAALATLSEATAMPASRSYPVFSYQYGIALLDRVDTSCLPSFRQFLATNHSTQYIKDTWQKMAIAYYVSNQQASGNYCLAQVLARGEASIDADRQAQRFAQSGIWPQKELLSARLLSDGGYYDRAYTVLASIDQSLLATPSQKAEYHYRLGRIYEQYISGRKGAIYYKLAMTNYRAAINIGKDLHDQFAARAALQSGRIFEYLQLKSEAIAQYRLCLDMPRHDFQNSIDLQAKAGINRLEGN